MRFADTLGRGLTLAALCAALAGCASLGNPFNAATTPTAGSDAPAPAPKEAKPVQAAASAPSRAASAAVQATPAPAADAPTGLAAVKAALMEAVSPPPVSASVQRAFDEAVRALRAGRTAEAERGFKALAASNPELGGAHANLGLIHRHAGKGAQAVIELEKAVAASPRQPLFFNQLGIAYREQGQFAKAREAYERAISLDAAYAAPLLNLGILHDLYLWDGKRALELYDRYLALAPGGDATDVKWVAELKNRKPQQAMLARKEKE